MSDPIEYLRDRITLNAIPFTERNSRILVFRQGNEFQIKLAESWSEDAALTYITWQFVDANDDELDVSVTSSPHRVDMTTNSGQFTLAFIDAETLMIQLPTQVFGLNMTAVGDKVIRDRRGAIIKYEDKSPLHMSYTTNAQISHHDTHVIEQSKYSHQLRLQPAGEDNIFIWHITRTARQNRYTPNPKTIIESSKLRWITWLNNVPNVSEQYQEQYYFTWWVIGVNLIRVYSYPYREGMIPSNVGYVGIWNWDSYFHAIALRHQDAELANNQFRILFDHQLENGMLPDVIQDDGALSHTTDYRIDAHITKPPLTAWAIWKVYKVSHDKAFLQEIYEPLVRSHRWWDTQKNEDGFFEYAHPYSSGLDNSPLFDKGVLETPDLTAYLILQADTLAKIAEEIDLNVESQQWTQEAASLTQRLIDRRWHEEAGLFWGWRGGQPVKINTPLSLIPMITGRLPKHITQRLVSHLLNSAEYWTPYPIPTVAKNDPYFDPQTMWRGPVWVNINYLLIEALNKCGYEDIARQLRDKTVKMIMRHQDIFEYYHPLTGEKPSKAVSIFGWSSALFIDLVIQDNADSSDR